MHGINKTESIDFMEVDRRMVVYHSFELFMDR